MSNPNHSFQKLSLNDKRHIYGVLSALISKGKRHYLFERRLLRLVLTYVPFNDTPLFLIEGLENKCVEKTKRAIALARTMPHLTWWYVSNGPCSGETVSCFIPCQRQILGFPRSAKDSSKSEYGLYLKMKAQTNIGIIWDDIDWWCLHDEHIAREHIEACHIVQILVYPKRLDLQPSFNTPICLTCKLKGRKYKTNVIKMD